MANVEEDLLYVDTHEWVREGDDEIEVGISAHAQEQLGDIVYLEFPDIGRTLKKGEAFGVIESVKTLSDLYAPVSGEVTAINTSLDDHPEQVNDDPYGEGWLIKMEPSDWDGESDDLMDAADYEAFLDSE